MASVPGSHYNVFAGNQIVNFGVTTDPNNVPAPVAGDFNLEVISNASGTGSFSTASGYQGLGVISTNGSVFTAGHGDYGVQDTGGNDSIFVGDGNVSILGAAGDTITGGTGGSQFIDAHLGNQLVFGGSAGNGTIWGGAGDTIRAGAGNVTIGGVSGDTITGGLHRRARQQRVGRRRQRRQRDDLGRRRRHDPGRRRQCDDRRRLR
jgi:Ca2+-binding RTX toxin-like protein